MMTRFAPLGLLKQERLRSVGFQSVFVRQLLVLWLSRVFLVCQILVPEFKLNCSFVCVPAPFTDGRVIFKVVLGWSWSLDFDSGGDWLLSCLYWRLFTHHARNLVQVFAFNPYFLQRLLILQLRLCIPFEGSKHWFLRSKPIDILELIVINKLRHQSTFLQQQLRLYSLRHRHSLQGSKSSASWLFKCGGWPFVSLQREGQTFGVFFLSRIVLLKRDVRILACIKF